jgi:hypothetical protein
MSQPHDPKLLALQAVATPASWLQWFSRCSCGLLAPLNQCIQILDINQNPAAEPDAGQLARPDQRPNPPGAEADVPPGRLYGQQPLWGKIGLFSLSRHPLKPVPVVVFCAKKFHNPRLCP